MSIPLNSQQFCNTYTYIHTNLFRLRYLHSASQILTLYNCYIRLSFNLILELRFYRCCHPCFRFKRSWENISAAVFQILMIIASSKLLAFKTLGTRIIYSLISPPMVLKLQASQILMMTIASSKLLAFKHLKLKGIQFSVQL